LAAYSQVGNNNVQVIGVLPMDKATGSVVYKTYQKVIYFPVKRGHPIDRIRIQLVDEYLDPILENPQTNTIITLHVRSRLN